MTPEQGALTLAGRVTELANDQALLDRVEAARAAVAAREAGLSQDGLVEDPPEELQPFIAQLQNHPAATGMFAEGWTVKIVDLRRVCSLQQQVHAEQAAERVASVDPASLTSIAEVTLPTPAETPLPAQYDETRNIWIISSGNPNLKIAGRFNGPVQPGVIGFGFLITVPASHMQVARHHGRYVLRDGYHRAFGLLQRGIDRAPAFVRDYGVGELGLGPGLFPTDVYLGERPPLLVDFLNDDVAADVQLPVAQKMIVISGMELSPIG